MGVGVGPTMCQCRREECLVMISPNSFYDHSFCANVHLSQSFWKTVKVTKRSCDVTPRSKYQKSKGPVPQIWCQFRQLFPGRPSLKGQSNHTVFKHTLAPMVGGVADPRNLLLIVSMVTQKRMALFNNWPMCHSDLS